MIAKGEKRKWTARGGGRVAPLACPSGLGSVRKTKAHRESKPGSKLGRQEIGRKG